MIKVVHGNPTPEELAAALAVVHARAAAATTPPGAPHPTTSWADPAHLTHHPLPPTRPHRLDPHLLAPHARDRPS
ncbi:hypothetical protein GCM10009564_55280 [Streptomyces thermogriseus]|uniref:Acyl-CoA carboxylase subunit epsilon n=1 Tax=Streptomyces thermogriseus TaxID=75292 RepID=A0ABN1T750_9ACTN